MSALGVTLEKCARKSDSKVFQTWLGSKAGAHFVCRHPIASKDSQRVVHDTLIHLMTPLCSEGVGSTYVCSGHRDLQIGGSRNDQNVS